MSATLHFNTRTRIVATDVNMNERNTAIVLSALGLNPNYADSEPIEVREMWAAANRYLTSDAPEVVDGGICVRSGVTPSGMRWTEGELREGYITEKAEAIKNECEKAMAGGWKGAYFA